MRVLRTIDGLRAALTRERARGPRVGLVPTMGAFHHGHRALMARARAECGVVVVSLFVNPAQFDDQRDLSAYPRDAERDAAIAAAEGVDLLFAPDPAEMYPEGFATTVRVGDVTEAFEGAIRGRAHFDGVATVVTKLFNIVAPDVAYFGQKDAQQVHVIRTLVRDIDLPVTIAVSDTVREHDGLAMSSRNVRLSPAERERAARLNRALEHAGELVEAGEMSADAVLAGARDALGDTALGDTGIQLEYLDIVDPDTFTPVSTIDADALILIAARIGGTRLIDNHLLRIQTQPLPTAIAAGSQMRSE